MNKAIIQLKKIFPRDCHERVFIVGGSVRDYLLAREGADMDLAAALAEETLVSLGFRLVEPRSSAPVWFRSDGKFGTMELTRLASIDALERDLIRRDFTINAMAMALDGNLIDPLNGRDDLVRTNLRICSGRSFEDDPLRVFRAFRFAADAWNMTPETEESIRARNWSDSFAIIPVERFSREMLKAFASLRPERFFTRMQEFRVGELFLPELFRMPAIPAGPIEHHPEGDLLTHSIQTLQRVTEISGNTLARFCAFFHDIGKLATDPACYPKHHGHDEAGFNLARELCSRLRLPTTFGTALSWVSRLHARLNKWDELREATRINTAEQAVKAGIAELLPQISAADKAEAHEFPGWPLTVDIARMSARELGIDPERLVKIPPGQRPAQILQKRIEKLRMITTW